MRLLRPLTLILTLSGALGCGSGEDPVPALADPAARESAVALLAAACDAEPADVYAAADPPEPFTGAMRGDIVRCAYDRFVTADEMRAHFQSAKHTDPGISTGAHKLRIAYWTTRLEGKPTLTTAALYLPAQRVAAESSLLVLGHGSIGIGDTCAPSRDEPDVWLDDVRSLSYSYAGDGWIAILPDNPGLGTEGATAWGYAIDEGHALLDATFAARKLLKAGVLNDKNVVIGHSIGGHAALAAQAYADSYGADGTLEAVIAYVPIWMSSALWGALLSSLLESVTTPAQLALSMKYFYGHLAAIEGEERATDAFLEGKRQEVRDFLEGGCWRDVTWPPGPGRIGIEKAADGFTPEYINEVGTCALTGTCETPLAATWKQRFADDRPPPVSSVPIVVWQGAKDDFVTPGFQKCGLDRLEAQGADLSVCIDPEGDHSTLVSNSAGWVRAYMRQKLLGGEAPSPCAGIDSLGQDLMCTLQIPNSTDPNEP